MYGMINFIIGRVHALIPEGNERKGEYHLYGINILKKNGRRLDNKERVYLIIKTNQ